MSELNILLADDEPSILLTVADALEDMGHNVTPVVDGSQALAALEQASFDLVLTDIRMPKLDGLAVFQRTRNIAPSTDIILMTAYATVTDAVTAMRDGAYDYLTKPFDIEEIKLRVTRIAEKRTLEQQLREARALLNERDIDHIIVGRSSSMMRLLDLVETLAGSDAPVLITGESGTGKELVAKTLHRLSPRHDHAFVAVNCAAFPETLLEAELFGHERGAFTGATNAREGRFTVAHQGTLFLDEIAEIPPMAQAKLLRVLQEGTIEPLGTSKPVEVDVRVVSATHRNLKQRIKDGLFREDLYYRLNVLDVPIPALRDRKGDLPILVEYFLSQLSSNHTSLPTITPRAWAALSEYSFPGNVRELEHAIQRALVLSRGKDIDLMHLPEDIAGISPLAEVSESPPSESIRPLAHAVKEFENMYLQRALEQAGGKKAKAAELLGISRKNLWEKMRSHKLGDSSQ
ncbi:MAG: sigma-54 dependent transcriptional regulator [Myxococcales bacterium]|nr:sigma-54 dependent transcriptional regulator [Myxococcales bacterium]